MLKPRHLSKRQRLINQIADLKEQRSRAILANAPPDDSRAGAEHPDVLALDKQIHALREQKKKMDALALEAEQTFPNLAGADGKEE